MRYSSTVLEHFAQPRNVGRLPDANASGRAGAPGRGNYMLMFLRVEGGRVARASFKTFGCPGAIASGSVLTDMVIGKTLEEAKRVDDAALLDSLGGLPPGREHCAGIAIVALRKALSSYGSAGGAGSEEEGGG